MSSDNKQAAKPDIFAPDVSGAVTVVTHPRNIHMYQVTEGELDNLTAAGNYKTLDVGLFALSFGIFISFLITIITSPPVANTLTANFFFMMCGVSFVSSIFFGIRAKIAWGVANKAMKQIKRDEIL